VFAVAGRFDQTYGIPQAFDRIVSVDLADDGLAGTEYARKNPILQHQRRARTKAGDK